MIIIFPEIVKDLAEEYLKWEDDRVLEILHDKLLDLGVDENNAAMECLRGIQGQHHKGVVAWAFRGYWTGYDTKIHLFQCNIEMFNDHNIT